MLPKLLSSFKTYARISEPGHLKSGRMMPCGPVAAVLSYMRAGSMPFKAGSFFLQHVRTLQKKAIDASFSPATRCQQTLSYVFELTRRRVSIPT